MAFTRAPMESVDQNQPISLLYDWDNRSDSVNDKDTLLKNALVEPVGQEYFHLLKRDGTEEVSLSNASSIGMLLSVHYWEVENKIVVVYIDNLQVPTVAFSHLRLVLLGAATPIAGSGIITGDEPVYWQDFQYQDGTQEVFFSTPGGLYKINNTGVATFVTSTVTSSLAFLDGYLFGNTDTSILNSNLNNPNTWSPGDFLDADSYPDRIRRISRVGNYIVALGTESVQYFYDAANPSGTPLGAIVGATKRIGYLGGYANIGDDVLFVGVANQGAPMIYRISGLKITPIASFPFSRFWSEQGLFRSANVPDGAVLNLNGHTIYYVRTSAPPIPLIITPPYVVHGFAYGYDLDTNKWTRLTYQNEENFAISSSNFWISPSSPGNGARNNYVTRLTAKTITKFNPTVYQDNGVNFEVEFRTRPYNFGTHRRKFGGRIMVIGDKTPTTSYAYLSWSDDDYQTTSTPRPVDMSKMYQAVHQTGLFRSRSFTLTYADNFPMRWRTLEFDYIQGSS